MKKVNETILVIIEKDLNNIKDKEGKIKEYLKSTFFALLFSFIGLNCVYNVVIDGSNSLGSKVILALCLTYGAAMGVMALRYLVNISKLRSFIR